MVIHAYLQTSAALAMGSTDVILIVSSARFPVHRAFISACCSTLAELLHEYAASSEVALFSAASCSGPATPSRMQAPDSSTDLATTAAASSIATGLSSNENHTDQTVEWMTNPAYFASFLLHLYSRTSQLLAPASEEQARMLVQLADCWGAPSLLPSCDAHLAMHLRSHGMELVDRTRAEPLGVTYRVSQDRLRVYLDLASRHRLRRLMAECMPFLWELPSDAATPLLPLLDGPVAAALCHFIFARKKECQGGLPGSCGSPECGAVTHVKFDAAVGVGTFAHRCTDCKLQVRSHRRMMADEVEEYLSQQGWGCC